MNKKKIIILVIVAAILAIGGLMLTRGGGNVGGGIGKTAAVPEDWIESVGDGLSFSYPEALDANFIGTTIWPPQGYLLGDGPLTCDTQGAGEDGQAIQKEINGNMYCITKNTEGATGSTYTQYAYVFEKKEKIFALLFGLRFLQCANYEPEKKGTCEIAQNSFSIDTIADQIAQSFKIDSIEDAPDTSVVPEGA